MSSPVGTRTQSVDYQSEKDGRRGNGLPAPGLVLVFSQGRACCQALPLEKSALEVGRGEGGSPMPADPKMSRRHAAVTFDGQRFRVADLGSHNGSFVDGVQVQGSVSSAAARILRTGESLFLLSPDVRPFAAQGVVLRDELVLGPSSQATFAQALSATHFGQTLHITGESGSGKEGLARAFHAGSPLAKGPFVALNCATIAAGVAERLLFGARRGAFSGATADSDGLVVSASGGTLFLDEIGELDPAVQAKLLRVLETREVLPMGALKPRRVDLQLCSASHRDLRAEVAEGRFREDLFFRISRPELVMPPLRQRLEEFPWLIERTLRQIAKDIALHASFVEACMLRHFPGNARELIAEVRAAAQQAFANGDRRIEAQHLDARAGMPIQRAPEPLLVCPPPWHPPIGKPSATERHHIEAALKQAGGNISAAARALGLHRTQLTRLMKKLDIRSNIDEALEQDTTEPSDTED